MLIIVNKSLSHKALKNLEKYGEVLLFDTQDITYKAIKNHPDIFLFPFNNLIIFAPNTPESFIKNLISKGIPVVEGNASVGSNYPFTAMYNAVLTTQYLIHNIAITDALIKENCKNAKQLNVHQGYTRCNLLALPNNTFITSDKGILKVLNNENLTTLYVNPDEIVLNGFSHGFFGGCCGISKDHFFINGSINYFKEKTDIERFINDSQLQLIELSTEKPEDIGSILIILKYLSKKKIVRSPQSAIFSRQSAVGSRQQQSAVGNLQS